jgi:hypothetical protein
MDAYAAEYEGAGCLADPPDLHQNPAAVRIHRLHTYIAVLERNGQRFVGPTTPCLARNRGHRQAQERHDHKKHQAWLGSCCHDSRPFGHRSVPTQ